MHTQQETQLSRRDHDIETTVETTSHVGPTTPQEYRPSY